MLSFVSVARWPGCEFFFAFAGRDGFPVRVQEQAAELGSLGEHAKQLLVRQLLADQVERQARRADAGRTVEQGARLDLGRELRAAGEHGRDIGQPAGAVSPGRRRCRGRACWDAPRTGPGCHPGTA